MSNVEPINMASVETSGGTQIRSEINEQTVKEYADAAKAGAKLPPIIVYHDGSRYWLADGFHRYWAASRRDCKSIRAEVRKGQKRDAILHAVGANAEHGLRRSNEDKRRAVMTMLEDSEWWEWSNAEIAKTAQVDDKTVAKYRDQLRNSDVEADSEAQNGDSGKRKGADGKKRPAKKKTSKKPKSGGSLNGDKQAEDRDPDPDSEQPAGDEEAEPAQPKPKNGAEVAAPKQRKEAYQILGKLWRALEAMGNGLAEKHRERMNAIAQDIRPPKQ